MKKKLLGILLSSLVLGAVSCVNVGLGEEIDTEAPKVTILSHKNNSFAPLRFTLSGEASDNHDISDIQISVECRETEDGEKITKTFHTNTENKKNGEWSYDLEFLCDQEVVINVLVLDKMQNTSMDSKASIGLVIDSQCPSSGSFGITRDSGYTTSTIPVSRFLGKEGKTALRTDSANKDYFQNESIVLSAYVEEKYEVAEVKMNLYEISDYKSEGVFTKTLVAKDIPVNENCKNLFNPEFTVTQSMLSKINPAYEKGVYYFYPELLITDGAGNENTPVTEAVPLVFAWESQYDLPKAILSPSPKDDGSIRIPMETPVAVRIFDDDGIKEIYWDLVKKTREPGTSRSGVEDVSEKNIRDHNFEIPTGVVAGKYRDTLVDGDYVLTLKIYDQNSMVSERTPKLLEITQNVRITNSDAPTINIKSPEYNSTPALQNESKFTIKGESIDNQDVTDIAIAWCRDGDSKNAIEYFVSETEGYNFATPVDKSKAIQHGEMFIWSIGQDTHVAKDSAHINEFSKTFDVYTDFMSQTNTIINDVKVFVIAVKDQTGNVTTEVFRLGAYNSVPMFKVEKFENDAYKELNEITISNPPNKEVKFRFTVSSALPVKTFNVLCDDAVITKDGDTCEVVIPSEKAKSDEKKVITYEALDKFENKNSGNLTIQFEKQPEIIDVRCNQVGEILKSTADVIQFQVTFDKSVTVKTTGDKKPYLKLKLKKDDVEVKDCEIPVTSTESSSTLYFVLPVEENIEFNSIGIIKENSNWIQLNDCKIERNTMDAILNGSGFSDKDEPKDKYELTYKLTVDTKRPVLESFGGQREGTTSNFERLGENKDHIEIALNFSEPVTAQNGNIVIYRKGSEDITSGSHTWHIPAVISADVFEKIWNNSTNENRIILSSSSTEKSVPETGTLVSTGPYKMYTNGLKLNDYIIYQYANTNGNAEKTSTKIADLNTVMVPDLTTKYVLDWQYDTYSTESMVSSIRSALEATNYHKTTIPLSRLIHPESGEDRKNKYILTLNDSDFIDGIRDGVEYIMEIEAGSFADSVQNTTKAKSTREFTVGKVAKPVIRVNRWSTNSNTQLDPYNISENYLKAGVKIDCETPDAVITYQVTNLYVESDYNQNTNKYQRNLYAPDIMPGPVGNTSTETQTKTPNFNNASSLTGGTPAFGKKEYKESIEGVENYSNPFYVGTGRADTGERIYIVANASTNIEGLEKSDDVYEGAFKTVLHYNSMYYTVNENKYNQYDKIYTGNNFKIFACQTPEGRSYVAGWPLSMRQHLHETSTQPEKEDGYKLAYKDTSVEADYKWVSWELLSDDFFTTTTVTWNFQVTIDTLVTYGSYVWGYKVNTWQMN